MGLVRIAIVTTVAPPSESQYKMQLISRPYSVNFSIKINYYTAVSCDKYTIILRS